MLQFQTHSKKYFKLYSTCIPVKGASRSVICDLQRESFDFIPNDLYEIISRFNGRKVKAILDYAGPENLKMLMEYFSFLIEKQYCFFTDDPDNFPLLNLQWESPFQITNAIIDFDSKSNHNLARLVSELNDVGCVAVELRFFYSPGIEYLISVLENTFGPDSRVRSIALVFEYSSKYGLEDLAKLQSSKIYSITLTSAPHNEIRDGFVSKETPTSKVVSCSVTYTTIKVNSADCCGFVSPNRFLVNVQMFTESQHHNSCLNRKISVDVKGRIKNCPSSNVSFGRLGEISFLEVILKRNFRKLWDISKDQIKVCKDCEFRFICTDCRVFRSSTTDIYAKPLKCNYDPYTAKWIN